MTTSTDPAPEEYRLQLDVDFRSSAWRGTVEFDLTAGGPECRLDVDLLTVLAVRLDGAPAEFRGSASDQQISIPLPARRPVRVSVDFTGTVGKDLSGLYRSRHGDGYVLTTQCEPTGARRIFPCVDRPDRKARILLTVRTDPDLEVVANTPAAAVRNVPGGREWTFPPTPAMATYLFYLGVGRFDRLEGRSRHAALRVLTSPGRKTAGRFGLDAARRILEGFEEYYGIDYPLPKLDLIAIEEHAFGAMENWGAISFQANRLLVDPSSSSFGTRDTFETIGHEIAHQWFGNLVTMRWWTDVWLNESFASLMETKISEKLDPALDARADFFLRVSGMAAAIDGDSLRSTHPVRTEVERPEEIGQIFDEISYGKGSSVLAMLEAYLGEDRFRAGVTDYLNRFRFGNARTEDLWESLGRVSGEPVGAIAGPWIDRPGLPVVAARLGRGGLELDQRRFTYSGREDAEPWPIPLILDVDGRTQRVMFRERTRTLPVPADATVHLNVGAYGFYRTLYDLTLYDRLLGRLPARPAPDRWIVLEDLMAFLASGDIGWPTYDRFVEALGGTPDRLVVESLIGSLVGLTLSFPRHEAVAARARSFFAGQYARLGPARREGEPGSDRILRERVAFGRARVDLDFARELASRFGEWDRIDPDLRLATAVGQARAGGPEGYRELRKALERTSSEADRTRLVRALGWAPDPALLRETLEFAVAGGVNRSYLTGLILQSSMNPAGRSEAWRWLTERIDAIAEVFRGSGYLPIVLESTTPYLGLGRASEVRAFFDRTSAPEGTRGIAKGLERLEIQERLGRHLAGGPARPGPGR